MERLVFLVLCASSDRYKLKLPQLTCGYCVTSISGLIYVTFLAHLKGLSNPPIYLVCAMIWGRPYIYGHNKKIYCTHAHLWCFQKSLVLFSSTWVLSFLQERQLLSKTTTTDAVIWCGVWLANKKAFVQGSRGGWSRDNGCLSCVCRTFRMLLWLHLT